MTETIITNMLYVIIALSIPRNIQKNKIFMFLQYAIL